MLAVIKIRGSNKTAVGIRMAFRELRLTRNNILVVVAESQMGQIKKAKDYIAWGEIDEKHLEKLLKDRGKMKGDKPLDDTVLKELGFASHKDMASNILKEKVKIKDIPDFKPVFRMNPPKGGYGKTKRPYKLKGALGYMGKDINGLIDRMLEGGKLGKAEN